jgi:hypothetical protein
MVLLIAAAAVVVGGSPVRAAHFTEASRDIDRHVPPSQASEPGSDIPSIVATAEGSPEAATFSASVTLFDQLSADCPTAGCSANQMQSNLVSFAFSIDPDPGEIAGTPVTLCIRNNYDRSIVTSGNFTASATVGGSPVTDPTSVVRDPGAIVLFANGPSTITSGTDARTFQITAHAAVGDIITLSIGEEETLAGSGIGGATVRQQSFLSVTSGACLGGPAPAASLPGLGALVLALAGLGARAARRASLRRP